MKFPSLLRRFALLYSLIFCFGSGVLLTAQTHPRLLIQPGDVASERDKIIREPFATIINQVEANANMDWNLWGFTKGTYIADYATVAFYRDSEAHAQQAAEAVFSTLSDRGVLDSSAMSIQRGYWLTKMALAYDLCYNSTYWSTTLVPAQMNDPVTGQPFVIESRWQGLTINEAVSRILREGADLLVSSGGTAWPGNGAISNNWFGVRYGGAIIAYYATDELDVAGVDSDYGSFESAIFTLNQYMQGSLSSDADSEGFLVEGHGYTYFPHRFAFMAALLLRDAGKQDFFTAYPGLSKTAWSVLPAVVPVENNNSGTGGSYRGLRPDLVDDHNGHVGEGVTQIALGFAYNDDPNDAIADFDYRPGVKWFFDHVWGLSADGGDETFDAVRGAGLLTMLYYPEGVTAQNPETVWGRNYFDPSAGVVAMRSRYGDSNGENLEDDFIFEVHANLRPNFGGHSGPDTMDFRILGLGRHWTTGPGRSAMPQGRNLLFNADPNTLSTNRYTKASGTTIDDVFLREGGGGYAIMSALVNDVGVKNQTRRMVVDYTSGAAADAFYVISDSSEDGLIWRLNAPDYHSLNVSGSEFILTSPEGHRMVGRVIHPAGASWTSGTWNRATSLRAPVGESDSSVNRWVQVESAYGDGEFVIALAVIENGDPLPLLGGFHSSPSDWQVTLTAHGAVDPVRTVSFDGDELLVSGWDRPDVTVTSPADGTNYNNGVTDVVIAGSATDVAPGTIQRVEAYLDGVLIDSSTHNAASVNWSFTLPQVPLGEHQIEIRAIDNDLDARSVFRTVRVNNSIPPEVAITAPAPTSPLFSGQNVTLRGYAYDPDGTLDTLQIYQLNPNGAPTLVGSPTPDGDGNWSLTLTNQSAGFPQFYALATDSSTDVTQSGTLTLHLAAPFASDPVWGDGAYYTIPASFSDVALPAERAPSGDGWPNPAHVRAVEGDPVLARWEGRAFYGADASQIIFPEGADERYWQLSWKARVMEHQNAAYRLWFGSDAYIEFRPYNTVVGSNGRPVVNNQGTYIGWVAGITGALVMPTYNATLEGTPLARDYAAWTSDEWMEMRVQRVRSDRNDLAVSDRLIVSRKGPGDADFVTLIDTDDANQGLTLNGSLTPFFVNGPISFSYSGFRADWMRFFYDDLTFVPTDGNGSLLTPNADSLVVWQSPADFADLTAGAPATLQAEVSDVEGVERVDFYAGSLWLGEATNLSGNTWQATWSQPRLGLYALTVRVEDADGEITTSPVRWAQVSATGGPAGDTPPVLTITSHAPNSSELASDAFELYGSATDGQGIAAVQILYNGASLGFADIVGDSWSFTMPGDLAAGSPSVTVRAYDIFGQATDASLSNLTITPNQAPTVSIVNPASSYSQVVETDQAILIDATDAEGQLARVVLESDGNEVAEASFNGTYFEAIYTERFYGANELTAVAYDAQGQATTSTPITVTVVPNPDPVKGSLVTYAGGTGAQRFYDVVELSDGTVLVSGSAEDLNWLPNTPVNLSHPDLPNRTTGRLGFILHLSSDLQSVLNVVQLPLGTVEGVRWLKFTHVPGTTTGDLYISGALDGDEYYVARLNGNFAAGVPSAIDWVVTARTSSTSTGHQPWDVGGDGRLAYLDTVDLGGSDVQLIRFVDSSGQPMLLPDLRGSHFDSNGTNLTLGLLPPEQDTEGFGLPTHVAGLGAAADDAAYSGIMIPRDVRSRVSYVRDINGDEVFLDQADIDSGTKPVADQPDIAYAQDFNNNGTPDWLEILPDGNGQFKRGLWPMDIFLTSHRLKRGNGATVDFGYTGYRQAGGMEISSLLFDRETNQFYFGLSSQSQFYDPFGNSSQASVPLAQREKIQPDFEAFVIQYDATGNLGWWTRMYHEWIDHNENGVLDYGTTQENYFFGNGAEPRLSPPDQFVDGLAIDYSGPENQLIVVARAHGGNYENFWEGNELAANPGGNSYHNRFTGSNSGDTHQGWIGRFDVDDGTVYNATYVAGFWTFTQTPGSLYTDPILDEWTNHNTGNPNTSSVFPVENAVHVDASGRIYLAGRAASRLPTTFNAYQKNPRHTIAHAEGSASWNNFVRVYTPDLTSLVYSSVLGGSWDYPVDPFTGDEIRYDPRAVDNPNNSDYIVRATNSNNVTLGGVFPTSNGLLTAGYQVDEDADAIADGNDVPVNLVPAWGRTTPLAETGVFARLSFEALANIRPSVTLDSPTEGSQFVRSETVTLTATATDFDGVIDRVEFYLDNALLDTSVFDGDDTYEVTWTTGSDISADGDYRIYARAIDDEDGRTDSAEVTVSVDGNQPPTVSLTNPANGQDLALDFPVLLTASASDDEGVARVEFYANGNLLQPDTTAPYRYSWTPTVEGSYNLTAVAFDAKGKSTTSTVVSVTATPGNIPPEIAVTAPGTSDPLSVAAPITLVATASDVNSTIVRVEFLVDGNFLGGAVDQGDGTWTLPWTPPASGTYTITATATDDWSQDGEDPATTLSAPVELTVQAAVVPPAPSALSAATGSWQHLNVSWTDNSDFETAFVLESSADGVSFAPLVTLPANTTSYAHAGLSPSQTLYYRVKATNLTGDSASSNIDSATTSATQNLQTYIWNSTLGGDWNTTAGNWSGAGSTWVNDVHGSIADLQMVGHRNEVIQFAEDLAAYRVIFGTGRYRVSGSETFQLGSGGFWGGSTNAQANLVDWDIPTHLLGNQHWQIPPVSFRVNGPISGTADIHIQSYAQSWFNTNVEFRANSPEYAGTITLNGAGEIGVNGVPTSMPGAVWVINSTHNDGGLDVHSGAVLTLSQLRIGPQTTYLRETDDYPGANNGGSKGTVRFVSNADWEIDFPLHFSSNASTNRLHLVQAGEGTLTISHAATDAIGTGNTANGDLIVERGTVRYTGIKAGVGAVTVNPYARLSGDGDLTGDVTVQSRGRLQPGDGGAETLTLRSNLSVEAEAVLELVLNADTGTASLIDLTTGTATLPGSGTIYVEVTKAGSSDPLASDTYTFLQAPGGLSGFSGTNWVISHSDAPWSGGQIQQNGATLEITGVSNQAVVWLERRDEQASEVAADPATIRFWRAGPTDQPLDVHLSLTGSATTGTDYAGLADPVTIPAGASYVDIDLIPVDDATVEGDETASVEIVADAAYALGSPLTTSLTLGDKPHISLAVTDAVGNEIGGNRGTWTLTRTGQLADTLEVYFTLGGTATSADYQAISVPVSFVDQQATRDITLTPVFDLVDENDETVILTLSPQSTYNIDGVGSGSITLENFEANLPPTVAISSPADDAGAEPGSQVAITAEVSDPNTNGVITQVEFFVNDASIGLGTEDSPGVWSTSHTFAAGDYTLTAEATDHRGGVTLSAGNTLHVVANTPPIADAGVDFTAHVTGSNGFVQLDGTGSTDAETPIARYEWYNGGLLIGTGPQPQLNFNLGVHPVTLRAFDGHGAWDEDVVQITVNPRPIALAGFDQVVHDEDRDGYASATLDASSSSDDGSITQYTWHLDGVVIGTGVSVTYAFPLGLHEVMLEVTDNDGGTDTDLVQVRANAVPVPSISADAYAGTAPLAVNFDATLSSDTDGTITAYAWDFGDGNQATGSATSHTFATVGTHTVTLTLTDNHGGTASTTVQVSTQVANLNVLFEDRFQTDTRANWSIVGDTDYPGSEGTPPTLDWRQVGNGGFDVATDGVMYIRAGRHGRELAHHAGLFWQDLPGPADYSQAYFATEGIFAENVASADVFIVLRYDSGSGVQHAAANTDVITHFDSHPDALVPGSWRLADFDWFTLDPANLLNGLGSQLDTNTVLANVVGVGALGRHQVTWALTRLPQFASYTIGELNPAPTVALSASPTTVGVGDSVQFDASSSTDSDGIAGYAWNFGDGNTATGAMPSHSYTVPGTYTAYVVVTDSLGAQSSESITVTVLANQPPLAEADSATLFEDETLDLHSLLLSNDTDPNVGDVLDILSVNPTGTTGQVSFDGAADTLTYTASGFSLTDGQSASDSFTYVLSDGQGGQATGTVTITVQGSQSVVEFRSEAGLAPDGSEDAEDAAGDGVPNLAKFAFNMGDINVINRQALDPDAGDAGLPVVHELPGERVGLTFIRRKDADGVGLAYQVQVQTDSGWQAYNVTPDSVSDVDGNHERVTISHPKPTSHGTVLLRIVLESSAPSPD